MLALVVSSRTFDPAKASVSDEELAFNIHANMRIRGYVGHRVQYRTEKARFLGAGRKMFFLDEPAPSGDLPHDFVGRDCDPADAMAKNDESRRVQVAVNRLPERHRQVMKSRYALGVPFCTEAELGRRFECTRQNIKLIAMRARERLRETLAT